MHFPLEDVKQNISGFLLAIVEKVSSGAGTTGNIFSGANAVAGAGDAKRKAANARRAASVIKQVHISSTQGPGIHLKVPELF